MVQETELSVAELQEGEGKGKDDDDGEITNKKEKQNEKDNESIWFHKLQVLIEHVRNISFDLVHVLGSNLSLDEMMIQLMGSLLKLTE